MTDLPAELLRRWPDRFRFGQLLVCLDGQPSPDPAALAEAVLDGIVRSRDHDGVLADLIRAGQFAAARTMLAEDTALTERQLARARTQLDLSLARYSQQLSDRLRKLAVLAAGASMPLNIDRDALESLCQDSWPQAVARLDETEEQLRHRISQTKEALEERLTAAQLPDSLAMALRSLLRSNRLTDAAWMLEQGNLSRPGPEAVPPLRPWTWTADRTEDVLLWHLDPGQLRPPEFSEWALADDGAYRVLADFRSLSGVEATARSFADSLDAFLGPPPEPVPLSRIADGWLTKLTNVFADSEIAAFGRPGQAVDLFIADPGITAPPPELAAVDRLIVVGPVIEAADIQPRTECAILSLQDLLQLVTVADRRPVALLRILARQWPLSALGASSAVRLDALLGSDPDTRWCMLRWLIDLAGIGGLPLAGMLAFQSGYYGPVLHVLLEHLVGSGKLPADSRWWSDDEQLSVEVEAAALREIRDSPNALAAFWTALRSAPPGQPVTLDAMVISAALDGDGADWDSELRRGLASLSRLWCADVTGESSVQLQPHGVVIGLRGRAQHRISALVEQLAEQAPESAAVQALEAWDAYRYALSEHWPAYESAFQDGDDARAAAAQRLLSLTAAQLAEATASADLAGAADVAELATRMQQAFAARYPLVTLTIERPHSAPSGISERAAMVLLYELLANAAETLAGGGMVAMSIEPSTDGIADLIIDVRDSGPGISADIPRDHLVFRGGVSTQGPGRGFGLKIARDLARRAEGDLELVTRSGRHPVLRGAHFRLILPARPENG